MWLLILIILFSIAIVATVVDLTKKPKIRFKKKRKQFYDGPKVPGYVLNDEFGMTRSVDPDKSWKIVKPSMSQGEPWPPSSAKEDEAWKRWYEKNLKAGKIPTGGGQMFLDMADELLIIQKMGVYRRGIRVIVSDTDECEPIYDII